MDGKNVLMMFGSINLQATLIRLGFSDAILHKHTMTERKQLNKKFLQDGVHAKIDNLCLYIDTHSQALGLVRK